MEFSKEFKNKIKLFAKRRFNRDLFDKEVLGWCQNLYYVGRAMSRHGSRLKENDP